MLQQIKTFPGEASESGTHTHPQSQRQFPQLRLSKNKQFLTFRQTTTTQPTTFW